MLKDEEITHSVNPSWTRESASFLADHRFVVLLSFMVLFLVTLPVLSHFSSTGAQRSVSIFTRLFFVGMLIAAVFAVGQGRRSLIIAIALAIPTVALQWISLAYDADDRSARPRPCPRGSAGGRRRRLPHSAGPAVATSRAGPPP